MQTEVLTVDQSSAANSRVGAAPVASVAARIAAHADTTPDRVALADGTTRLTFSELDRQSSHLAGYLRAQGVQAGSCIGLFMERSPQFVVAALAVLKSGAAYLPMDPTTPADRAAFILGDAGAPLLLTHRNKTAALPNCPCRIVDLDQLALATSTDSPGHEVPALDSLAYVIYTSGSTGRPKGVELTHSNLLNLIDWHQAAFAVTPADRASQVAGLGFDAAVWEIWPALASGASLHFADEMTRRSPQALRDWIVAERITISFVPTVLAEQLLHSEWPTDTALRTLLTGADTLHRRPRAGLPFKLVNNYGPTECTVVATSGAVDANDAVDGPPSIGRPISNTTVFILDDAMLPVADGQPGELCLAGTLVGRGYRNNPEMTASRFVTYAPASGPAMRVYRTGDRARRSENGEIAFLGRLDDQVKIRGYRIELGEIVACLDRFLGVEASAVTVRDDAGLGPRLVAYIVAAPAARVTPVDLREFLAARLPDYMIPAAFVTIDALPLTLNGKLDKSALPAPPAEALEPKEKNPLATPAPGSELEQRIAAMVSALLGQTSIAREDNFFMAGGHSMLGVQLVARIRDSFGVKLNLRQLFGAPTIAALSLEVEKLSAAKTA